VPILLNASHPVRTENHANKKKNLYSKFNINSSKSSDQIQQQGFTSSPSSNSNIDAATTTNSQQVSSESTSAKQQPKEEPMDTSSLKEPQTPTSSSTAQGTTPAAKTAIDVDKWFDDIQHNQSTCLIGKNLKSYAQIFKLVALKIATGFSSTLSSNTQKSFVSPTNSSKAQSQLHQQASQSKTQFAATLIPTMSSINLDKSLFEELKPSKLATQMPVIAPLNGQLSVPAPTALTPATTSSSSSLLSNLLTQRSNTTEIVVLDPINNQTSSPHTSMMPQQQAQILTNYNQYGGSSTSSHGSNSAGSSGSTDLNDNAFNISRSQG